MSEYEKCRQRPGPDPAYEARKARASEDMYYEIALDLMGIADTVSFQSRTLPFCSVLKDVEKITHALKWAHAAGRREAIAEVRPTLEFYASGGNFQADIWQHPDLGYFTGKRARALLDKLGTVNNYGTTQLPDTKVVAILKYCQPHTDQMWAATIVSILLDCEFRDAECALLGRLK